MTYYTPDRYFTFIETVIVALIRVGYEGDVVKEDPFQQRGPLALACSRLLIARRTARRRPRKAKK